MGRLTTFDKNLLQLLENGFSFPQAAYKLSVTVPQLKKKVTLLLNAHPDCLKLCQENKDLVLWKEELALGKFVGERKKEFYQLHKGVQLTSLHYDSLSNLPFTGTLCHLKEVASYFDHLSMRWTVYSDQTSQEDLVGIRIGRYQKVKTITKEDCLFMASYLQGQGFTVTPSTIRAGLLYYVTGTLDRLTEEEIRSSIGLEKPFQLEKRVIGGKYRE